jgi:hypothetical protein
MPDEPTPGEEAPDTPAETGPSAPEAPEPTETPEPDKVDSAAAKARREARNLRERLKEAQGATDDAVAAAVTERDETIAGLEAKLLEAKAQLAAVGKLRNPADVTRFVDVHEVGLERLDAAIAAVVKERPYLAVATENAGKLPQGQQNGDRPTGPDANEWLREQLQRR